MVRQYFIKLSILLLLGSMLLTACSELEGFLGTATSPTVNTPATGSDNPTVEAQLTPVTPTDVQPTLVPTSTSTPDPVDTATHTPSPTFTETATPVPTDTPTPQEPVVFAVVGDYGGNDEREADVAELIKSWEPEFILTVGDNNYQSGESETIDANIGQFYSEYIYPYTGSYGEGADKNRFFPVLGNHDTLTGNGQPYLDYFSLPGNERYYDFVWGPVHLFAVNNVNDPDGINASSVQAAWLDETMAASSSPWQIVYMHYPPYSSGYHGSIDWAQWPYAEWGADAVLAGNDHSYERLHADGIPHFVNGLGGIGIYQFNLVLPESQLRYNADYGAMRVEATEEYIKFEFINRYGEVIDTYEVRK